MVFDFHNYSKCSVHIWLFHEDKRIYLTRKIACLLICVKHLYIPTSHSHSYFEVLERIREWTFEKVYKGRHKADGLIVALKET
jgi:hypothetical protein